MKNKLKIVVPILLVSSSAFVLFQLKKEPILTNNNSTSPKTNSINSTDETVTPTVFQKLSVLSNRCLGCGKCVRIDAAHFEIVGRVAKVISSTNLNSSSLVMAINNCPGQAITLN